MENAKEKLEWLKGQRQLGRFVCSNEGEDSDLTTLINQCIIESDKSTERIKELELGLKVSWSAHNVARSNLKALNEKLEADLRYSNSLCEEERKDHVNGLAHADKQIEILTKERDELKEKFELEAQIATEMSHGQEYLKKELHKLQTALSEALKNEIVCCLK